jgi:hypothetical protein
MSRTYGFIDRGELAAVATTLGVAHIMNAETREQAEEACETFREGY